MTSIRKTKKQLKKQIRGAYKAERLINKEHMASRTIVSLLKVVAIREWIELLEHDLEKLKQKKKWT